MERRSATALVAHILEFIEPRKVIFKYLPLVLEAVRGVIVDVESIFVGAESTITVGRSHIVFAPRDETEVEEGGRETPVGKRLGRIYCTQIEAQAEAVWLHAVNVHAGDILVMRVVIHFRLIAEVGYAGVDFGVGQHVPAVIAEVELRLVHAYVHITKAYEELYGRAHTPLGSYVARVVQSHFGICLSLGAEIGNVVVLVADTLFCKLEKGLGNAQADVGTSTYRHGIVAADALETKGDNIYFGTDVQAVGVFEFLHHLRSR